MKTRIKPLVSPRDTLGQQAAQRLKPQPQRLVRHLAHEPARPGYQQFDQPLVWGQPQAAPAAAKPGPQNLPPPRQPEFPPDILDRVRHSLEEMHQAKPEPSTPGFGGPSGPRPAPEVRPKKPPATPPAGRPAIIEEIRPGPRPVSQPAKVSPSLEVEPAGRGGETQPEPEIRELDPAEPESLPQEEEIVDLPEVDLASEPPLVVELPPLDEAQDPEAWSLRDNSIELPEPVELEPGLTLIPHARVQPAWDQPEPARPGVGRPAGDAGPAPPDKGRGGRKAREVSPLQPSTLEKGQPELSLADALKLPPLTSVAASPAPVNGQEEVSGRGAAAGPAPAEDSPTGGEPPQAGGDKPGDEPEEANLEQMARQVYQILRRRLIVEHERVGGRAARR